MSNEIEVINCTFSTENSLYLAYMPFIKGGGLFIRTLKDISMGTLFRLSIQLLNEPQLFEINTKVIWITPKGAQGNKPSGIGVQFMDEKGWLFNQKIETILAAMLKSTQLTDTL